MLTIRAATLTDLPALALLWHEKMILQTLAQTERRVQLAPDARQAWIRAAQGWLDDAQVAVIVAEQDGVVIGYTVGRLHAQPGRLPAHVGLITELALDAHGYHGGAGRSLVDALRTWFKTQGVEQVAVWTPHNDAVGQAFWRSLGTSEWVDVLWLK